MIPDLITLPSFEPGTPEWHDQRKRSVGGSEIAPILGIGKWDSRFSLWHRKRGNIGPQADNPQMEWGRLLEPVILDKFISGHFDAGVTIGGSFSRTSRPWQIASPDALCDDGIVEVKTAYSDDGWGEPGTDQIPVYYRAQCIWYLDVLAVQTCHVAVLISGSDYREYVVTYDEFEAELMRAEAEAFIASIDADERPDIDTHSATYQAIRDLHPDIDPVKVELPADLARSYCGARHALDDAKADVQRQTSLVADTLGNGQHATFNGQTIARRQAKNGGTPFLVAANDLPTFNSKVA